MSARFQKQRFEYKYHVNERQSAGIRDFLLSYMEPDAFAGPAPDYAYPVHSLYMDSPDLCLYRAALHGERNRYKLRFRYYEMSGDPIVFAEIKQRCNAVILKERVPLCPEAARQVAQGQLPGEEFLHGLGPETLRGLDNFVRRISLLNARPVAHVVYDREAWAGRGPTNNVRVTLDRRVLAEPRESLAFQTHQDNPKNVFGDSVILELKFTDRFPLWFHDLVSLFDLRNQGAAKYVDGVTAQSEPLHVFA